jgi:hypothetical protein
LVEGAVIARLFVGGLTIAALMSSPLGAQIPRPLVPLPDDGLRVVPFFDGWYANPDGTFTLSFGYSNLNRNEVVEIALGPDNFIEPKEYDGRQPTSFPPVAPDTSADGGGAAAAAPGAGAAGAAAAGAGAPGGRGGRGTVRRERERGVFTITVPAAFRGDVIWTLRYRGQTYSVPGRAKSEAYRLSWPMANGSVPPLLRFKPNGPTGRGPAGIQADPVRTSVGTPLPLTILITDDSVRDKDPITIKEREGGPKAAMNVNWFKHTGPGPVVFSPPKDPIAELEGKSTTSATFKQAGEYVIRVRADNFGRVDTSAGNQCCWTNGYVKVSVTP